MTRAVVEHWQDFIQQESATGCWIWTGAQRKGYGRLKVAGKYRQAHTFVYEQLVGPMPEGTEPDHTCRVRLCVNPNHMEPVTHAENVRRGLKGVLRTRCAQGHRLTPDNVRIVISVRGTSTICRTCERKWKREYAQRRRAAGLKA